MDHRDLPGHVEMRAGGGLMCAHCGGEVSEDGASLYAPEPDGDEDDAPQGEELDALFAKATRG